jgi:integrase
VGGLTGSLAPNTIKKYRDFLRLVLDHADIEPNPARSRKVRLPVNDAEEINPPPYEHWFAIRDSITPRFSLHVILMENTGIRIGELFGLTWGDVDARGQRLRIARTRTKGQRGRRRSRFIYPSPEIMEWIDELVPLEDRRPDVPIFEGGEYALRRALTNACKFGKVPHYYPHHLRHRFISVRVQAGWPAPLVARAVGHTKTSITHDTYSHVLTDEPNEIIREAAREQERWSRGASVVPSDMWEHEQITEFAG